MSNRIDLINGPVLSSLSRLAFPIMATSLIQMAYNLTDMLWIGRIGSDAVAAVGAAGMYTWLSSGLSALPKMGGQVNTGHALGAGSLSEARSMAAAALWMSGCLGILFGLLSVTLAHPLVAFFRLNSPWVIQNAEIYLKITCGLIVFSFLNQYFTGIFTAEGNSRSSFIANFWGLMTNIILDPVLIFGLGPFPEMKVAGAAAATVLAQIVSTIIFIICALQDTVLFRFMNLLAVPSAKQLLSILRIGLPTCVQNMIFPCISMIISRMVASYGDAAVAVQKVGSQVESVSWMTADGFAAAVNSFLSQNHGAGRPDRIREGYNTSMKVVIIWGIFCTVLLVGFPEQIFRLFISEQDVIPLGVDYLRILGVSQLMMSVEITTAGAFAGLRKTLPPSVCSIVLTGARIPLAYLLIRTPLELNGIWWSITISSICKGLLLLIWFRFFLNQELLKMKTSDRF